MLKDLFRFILCLALIYAIIKVGLYVESRSKKECNITPIVIQCNRPKTSYETSREKLIKAGLSYEISEHITWECFDIQNKNLIQKCISDTFGVSGPESSVFKDCGKKNNCFGLKEKGVVLEFPDKQGSVTKFVDNREKVYFRFNTPDSWLKANYCYASGGVGCEYRTGAFIKAQSLYLNQK